MFRRHERQQKRAHLFLKRKIADIPLHVKETRIDAQHIPIHGGYPLTKRDRGDCPRGVFPDAGQGNQRIIAIRHYSAESRDDFTCCFFQISCAAIVAQTFPELVQAVVVYVCQRVHIRQLAQKPLVIRNHGGNARLLQHDFTDPDGVPIPRPAPGQIPRIVLVPVE
ncbi:hypothetical protein SDC9_97907 [bioreactor metagenome]|uniref:Uncharacterized protein n=1 Tax=bioreactor metagenome TaxID=1076179 RepID=A0A645ADB7_9ZZZZ